MNSKEMYDEFRRRMSGKDYSTWRARAKAIEVIKQIAEEISRSPYNLANSPFIMNVQNELYRIEGGQGDCDDLYAITMSISEYI